MGFCKQKQGILRFSGIFNRKRSGFIKIYAGILIYLWVKGPKAGKSGRRKRTLNKENLFRSSGLSDFWTLFSSPP